MNKKLNKSSKNNSRWDKRLHWLIKSVWLYPLILLIVLSLLTVFKINGSSVGIYHQRLYGIKSNDPALIYGKPKLVRADEWQNGTPIIIAQSKNSYKKINDKLGSGRNLALLIEAPTKDWSTIFRPYNLPFFFLGFDFAYALKWWLPLFALLVSSYFFILRIFPRKKLLASLLSLGFGLSPFLLWWYQTGAFGAIACGFLILILIHRIMDLEPIKFIKNNNLSKLIYVLALAFVASCFALLFYPPFQIPIAVVVLFYTLGYLVKKNVADKVKPKLILKRSLLLVAAALITCAIGLVFIKQNQVPIRALSNTFYPGKRVTHSGDLNLLHVFNGFLMPFQQQGAKTFRNLSESSNFILLMPFLLIPGFVLLFWEYKKQHKIDFVLLAIQLCATLFLLRAFVHFGDPFYKLILLNRVPNTRLIIGMGFVGFLQFIYILKKVYDLKTSKSYTYLMASTVGLATFLTLIYISFHVRGKQFNSLALLMICAAIFASIVFTILIKKPLIAVLIFFSFSVISGFRVVPLYKGLGLIKEGAIVQAIEKDSKPEDSWITVDDIEFENLALVAGRKNLSGSQIYPDLNFWHQIEGAGSDEHIYNREAHAYFTTEKMADDIHLVKSNLFKVRFYCSNFILKNVDYALSLKPLNYKCTSLIDTVIYPKKTFYIYKISES